MSADIKLRKAQIKKIIKSGGALGSILGRFLPKLIKPAISLGKDILAPLGLSAAMIAADSGIQKKIHGYGKTIKFSDEDIKDMTKIVKVLENSDFLMKGVAKTFKNDIKKGGALPILAMLLGTLGSLLIGNLLTGRGLYRVGSRQGMYRAGNQGKRLFREEQGIKKNH